MKATDNQGPLFEGLVYEDCLPLAWKLIDKHLEGGALDQLNESNESLLKIFATLEDQSPARPENDEDFAEIHYEMIRIDLKLNLLLELVKHVLNQQIALPDRFNLRVGARGIEWRADRPPPAGSYVKLDLFLLPRYPLPIELPGQVVGIHQDGKSAKATVAFRGLSEPVQDWIEKIIFRHHRRSIANKRLSSR